MSKRKGTRQDIEYRFKREVQGKVRKYQQPWVHLECGHEQPEQRGGRSKFAESAICLQCRADWDARRTKRISDQHDADLAASHGGRLKPGPFFTGQPWQVSGGDS